MQEIQVQSMGQEDPLEKEMATHFNTLAWKIPWTEELAWWVIVHAVAKESDTSQQLNNDNNFLVLSHCFGSSLFSF